MLKYRSQQSLDTPFAASQALAQHAPATPLKSSKFQKSLCSKAVLHFQLDNYMVDNLLDNVDASLHQVTVQKEFNKYMAALPFLLEMDIVNYWAASYTYISRDKQC